MRSLIATLFVACCALTASADILWWTVSGVDETFSYAKLNATSSTATPPTGGERISATEKGSAVISVDVTNYTDKSFYIELLNENLESVATSQLMSYEALASFRTATTTPTQTAAWTGGSYTAVPEPTSALLMLLGMAGLALKRKQVA